MRRALVAALGLTCGACVPGPRVGAPIDAGPTGEAHSFGRLAREIFTPTCGVSQCHAGNPPRAPMSLEEGNAYQALVEAPSTQVATMRRVAPEDPRQSYLLHKLRGTAGTVGGSATRMPPGRPGLDEALIDAIDLWIQRGAPND